MHSGMNKKTTVQYILNRTPTQASDEALMQQHFFPLAHVARSYFCNIEFFWNSWFSRVRAVWLQRAPPVMYKRIADVEEVNTHVTSSAAEIKYSIDGGSVTHSPR